MRTNFYSEVIYIYIYILLNEVSVRVRVQDGVIDFLEFVAAVHLVLRGKLQDRLRWSFKVYDRDENGKLDKSEVKNIIDVRRMHVALTVS